VEAERNSDDALQPTSDVHAIPPHDQAILVGLDGWHLSRVQLDVLPEPQIAHDREAATGHLMVPDIDSFIRSKTFITNGKIITAPSFDHALKYSTQNAVSIHPHHSIIVIEGHYVFLAFHPWRDGGLLSDERWFIQIDPKEARRRLVGRHVSSEVAKDTEEVNWRADENDIISR
jgi:pantothenate kinase